MNLFKSIFLNLHFISLAFSFCNSAQAQNVPEKEWKVYLPSLGKTLHADIMTMQPSDEFAQLAAKMQANLKRNPSWALEFARSAPKGQPLPYHENLGLTKQEYERMQKLTREPGALSLKKTGTLDITFEPLSDGRIKIVSKTPSMFNNLVLSAKEIETNWGKLTEITRIDATKTSRSPIGPWTGIAWKKNTVDERTIRGESIQFAIGKRIGVEGQGIIYYDGKMLKGSAASPVQFTQILFFRP